MRIGFLHPGSMGVSLAASVRSAGHDACWASTGRSAETLARASEQSLTDLVTVAVLCDRCDAIVSICPPKVADAIAAEVASHGFAGAYLDANAISPARAAAIATTVTAAGARYIDGGVIGGPAWQQDKTTLYLSGPYAPEAVPWFTGGLLATRILSEDAVAASAMKMCYAAYTKGTSALLYAILGTAEALGVRDALVQQWSQDGRGLDEKALGSADGVTSRAWRWIDEMQEISRTFEGAGLPGGFHEAAAEIFSRLEDLQHETGTTTDDVVAALLAGAKGDR